MTSPVIAQKKPYMVEVSVVRTFGTASGLD